MMEYIAKTDHYKEVLARVQTGIITIILLIVCSFQRKGVCNSGLKAKSTTFAYNNK